MKLGFPLSNCEGTGHVLQVSKHVCSVSERQWYAQSQCDNVVAMLRWHSLCAYLPAAKQHVSCLLRDSGLSKPDSLNMSGNPPSKAPALACLILLSLEQALGTHASHCSSPKQPHGSASLPLPIWDLIQVLLEQNIHGPYYFSSRLLKHILLFLKY